MLAVMNSEVTNTGYRCLLYMLILSPFHIFSVVELLNYSAMFSVLGNPHHCTDLHSLPRYMRVLFPYVCQRLFLFGCCLFVFTIGIITGV